MSPTPTPDSLADPTAATERIRTLAEGWLFRLTVHGDSLERAGIFDGDRAVLRRQDTADAGELVAVHYPDSDGTAQLELRYYHPADGGVWLATADPTVAPLELAPEQVAVLGVLVSIEGTVQVPDHAGLACEEHRRFLRPKVCTACAAAQLALTDGADPHQPGATPPAAVALPIPDPGGPCGWYPQAARLLGRLADRLRWAGEWLAPGGQVAVDLDEHTCPVEVYNALLYGAGALAHNQQLRAYLDRLASEHVLTALTAAHMWELLGAASTALDHHRDLSAADRELLRLLGELSTLAELVGARLASVPDIGIGLYGELEAAREVVRALQALDDAKDGGDAEQLRDCQQRLDQARKEYRDLAPQRLHLPRGSQA
jgi:hypothetical protein